MPLKHIHIDGTEYEVRWSEPTMFSRSEDLSVRYTAPSGQEVDIAMTKNTLEIVLGSDPRNRVTYELKAKLGDLFDSKVTYSEDSAEGLINQKFDTLLGAYPELNEYLIKVQKVCSQDEVKSALSESDTAQAILEKWTRHIAREPDTPPLW